MQTTFKVVKRSGFVTVTNDLARDKRLSFKARGLMLLILSHSGEWNVTASWLEEQGLEGREAIRSGLNELKALNYARYDTITDGSGRFSGARWTFYEEPADCAPEVGEPIDSSPNVGNPIIGTPSPSEDNRTEDNSLENNVQKPPLIPQLGMNEKWLKRRAEADQAEQLYALYPKKVAKPEAIRAISKALKREGFEKLCVAVAEFAKAWAGVPALEMGYCPYPASWFNKARYNDCPSTWGPRKSVESSGVLTVKRSALIDTINAHPCNPESAHYWKNGLGPKPPLEKYDELKKLRENLAAITGSLIGIK